MLLNQRGVFPILLLVAIGLALVGGGTYVVKNNLVTTKGGQIVFNAGKDKSLSDAKIPSPENITSNNSPAPKKAELAEKTAEYKPETGEPKFSISPPAGWVKENGQGKVKLFFEASQEDKKEIGYSFSRSTANIQVTSEKSNAKSLDEVMTKYKSEAAAAPVKIEVLKEQKTTFAGQDAIGFELIVGLADISDDKIQVELKKAGNQSSVKDVQDMLKSGKVRGLGYIILKDGYEIGIAGTALGPAWDKRGPAIESSINSFKFLDDTKPGESPKTQQGSGNNPPPPTAIPTALTGLARFPEYSAAKKGEFSYDPSPWLIQKSSGKAFPKFKINILPGWMQKISENKEDPSFMLELRPIDNSTTPTQNSLDQAVVLIVIRKDDHTDAEQFVIDTFGRSQIRELRKYEAVNNNGREGRYLEQEGGSKTLAEYIYLINGFSINISGTAPSEIWNQISPSLKQTINSFVFVN